MKTYYYSDERNDDFANTNGKINCNKVDGKYVYHRKSLLWRIMTFVVYRVIATPLVWIYCKVHLGIRVKNRKALRKVKSACFIYGNHTQNIADAFIPSILSFPRRAYILTGAEAVSIKGIKHIVALLGAVPLPSTLSSVRNFSDKLSKLCEKRCTINVYPEAHIWPYYNGIRDFPDTSFSYPVRLCVPAVAYTVVYRQRLFFKHRHPHATVYISEPFYPDTTIAEKQARKILRDNAYNFMKETARKNSSFEYIHYEKVSDNSAKQKNHISA